MSEFVFISAVVTIALIFGWWIKSVPMRMLYLTIAEKETENEILRDELARTHKKLDSIEKAYENLFKAYCIVKDIDNSE